MEIGKALGKVIECTQDESGVGSSPPREEGTMWGRQGDKSPEEEEQLNKVCRNLSK